MYIKKIVFAALLICCFLQGYAQQRITPPVVGDSLLLLFINDLQNAVKENAFRQSYSRNGLKSWTNSVSVQGIPGSILIDSLYKYGINDIDSISVKFDQHPAVYGIKAPYGVIIMYPKKHSKLRRDLTQKNNEEHKAYRAGKARKEKLLK